MKSYKVGIAREGKVPPDFRVPLTPEQCSLVQVKFPNVEIIVQNSPIRTFSDAEYEAQGIRVQEDLSECDIIMGVKEFIPETLIPNKTYIFFSHTLKKQPYNKNLLRTVLQKKIRLIDYEVMKNRIGKRLIGFGRYAGIVGCYNGFRTLGLKSQSYRLLKASECENRIQLEEELKNVKLANTCKIVLTGGGRVGYGAREILDLLPILEVTPEEFLTVKFDQPVFTHLGLEDYYARKDGAEFDKSEFYSNPEKFKSIFEKYAKEADMFVAGHYWSENSPVILSKEALKDSRLIVLADISCDIDGPLAPTIKPSTIENPIYGYNPKTGLEDSFLTNGNIAVMAVDNLPCELPKDASEDFGNELIRSIFPALFVEDPDDIIGRASETTFEGELTEKFAYLSDYVGAVPNN
ncbi:MAG: NAD(P)-dependent oxidoreductase [Crocinitomicaceae bacterium]|nr:NAD(P)-dependent oxidoreductase [Crocinitomicaceae bacterium]